MAPPIDVGTKLIDDEGASADESEGATTVGEVALPPLVIPVDSSEPAASVSAMTADPSGPAAEPTTSSGLCEMGGVELTGSLDGADYSVEWVNWSSHGDYHSGLLFNWSIQVGAPPDVSGHLILYAPADAPSNAPETALAVGETLTLSGGMYMPPARDGVSVYCIGEGSTLRRDASENTVDLRGIGLLGSCPGRAATGSLNLCFGDAERCTTAGGAIDGVTISDAQVWGGRRNDIWSVDSLSVGLFRWYEHADADSDPPRGTLSSGVLFTPLGGPHGGAVYCIGEGSWETLVSPAGGPTTILFTLDGLTSLGTCAGRPPGSDSLSGCVQ